jgi:hypothetical protein
MRKLKRFSAKEVSVESGCKENTSLKYCQMLLQKGVLEVFSPRKAKYESNQYRLLDRYEGFLRMPLDYTESDRDRLWLAMRVHRKFTNPELQISSGASKDSTDWFLKRLKGVGILTISTPHESGVTGSFAIYRLVRDLGVFAPICLADNRVFDPNSLSFVEKKNGENG